MAFQQLAYSGADRSEGLSARFVANSGTNGAVCGTGGPRKSPRQSNFAAPNQHKGKVGTYGRYLCPLQEGDTFGGRANPTGRRAARTAPVGGTPAPTVDARIVPVSLWWTERVCRTRGWAAPSGLSGPLSSRRLPRHPRCPRRRAWWGTAAGLPLVRVTSSSSHRDPGEL